MAAVIEVEDLPSTDRVEILRDHMLHAPIPLELHPVAGVDLRARSSVAELGRVHLLSTLGSGAAVVRTARLARDDTEPHLVVTVLGGGRSSVFQRDRLAHMRAGSVVLLSTAEPYWATFHRDTLRHSFQIPMTALQLPGALVSSLTATPLAADRPLTDIVASHLRRVARSATTLTAASRSSLEQPTLDLIRSLVAASAGREDLARAASAGSLRARILEFVHMHLTDPELGAPMIAAALGISERYVYAVTRSADVSLGDWIRQQRVDAAAAFLARPEARTASIAAVAHRFAFADHSHFTRSFRAARGMTPSEWRRSSADGPTPRGDDPSS